MDKVCGYYGCENIITPDYVPVWKEFKLFGQTWIIGRWKNEVVRDKCIDCSIQKEQDRTRSNI